VTVSDWILARCDRTYRSRNWAAKGVLSALREVTAEVAHWRPHPDQHTIAEIVLHMAFWKDVVASALSTGVYRYAKSEDWRAVEPTKDSWEQAQDALRAAHHRLIATLRQIRDRQLMQTVRRRRKYTVADLAVDIATHDSYHVGQIFVLRRIYVTAISG
jgi:uncharacterized damage-inducible protein DinB